MSSKLQKLFEEQDHMDRILIAEGAYSDDSSQDEDNSEATDIHPNVLDDKMKLENGLVDTYHTMRDFFEEQGLEVGTCCNYPSFYDWITDFISIIEIDESEEEN